MSPFSRSATAAPEGAPLSLTALPVLRPRPPRRLRGASVYLFGANGAGKTNLLEAISLLSPGKGLRGSSLAEVGRRLPGEATGRPWAVSALVEAGEDEPVQLGAASRWAARPAGWCALMARPFRQAG